MGEALREKSRLSRQLVGELQLWLFYSRGGATEKVGEGKQRQRRRRFVQTEEEALGGDSLDGVCFGDFLCLKGQCFTCLQILLSRLERGSNKGCLSQALKRYIEA